MTVQIDHHPGRIGRRALLRSAGLGTIGLAGAALVGCSGGTGSIPAPKAPASTSTAAATTAAKSGGTLRYSSIGDPGPLDLMTQSSGGPFYFAGPAYSGLLTRSYNSKLDMTFEPDLAESWERQPDGLAYVFRLRPNVKFHNRPPTNGRVLKTDDIKFSLEREVSGTVRPRKAQYDTIAKIEFPDERTLKLTLKVPAADFLAWVADPYHIIVPTEVTDDFAKADAVGTGPFILKSYRGGVGSEFAKNPDYFRDKRPYLDGIKTTLLADQAAMIASFRAGNLDLSAASAGGYLRPSQVKQVTSSIPKAQIYEVPNVNIGHIRYNLEVPPFNDKRIRQAFGLMIDDKSWINALYDGDAKRTAPMPAALGSWALPVDQLPARGGKDQIKQATDLMAAAGYGSDKPLAVRNDSLGSPPSAGTLTALPLLEETLKPLNVKVTTSNNDTATQNRVLVEKRFQMQMINGVLGFTEAGTYVETYYWDKGGRGYTKHNDAHLNDLIVKQSTMLDEKARMNVIADIQKRVISEEYYTMLQADTIRVAGLPAMRGHSLDLLHGGNMRNSWQWWLDA